MIIFLFGKDSYRSQQKLREIIRRYQEIHRSGLNLLKFQPDGFDLMRFQDQVRSVSMFAEKKLVVCDDFLQNLSEPLQEKLLDFLKAAKIKDKPEMILVFYESDLPNKKLKLFQFLKRKPCQWQEFDELKANALESWIKQEVNAQGVKIEEAAVKKLGLWIGANLWQMHNEIAKLSSYVAGSGEPVIRSQDLDVLISESILEPNVFKTIDALGEQNKKTALRLLSYHFESGTEPLYLLSMFIYQWRNLLQIKDLLGRRLPYYVLAKKTGLHPFVVRKTYQQAQRFSLEQLKANYLSWQTLDQQVKKGGIDVSQALATAVLRV